MKLYYPLVVGLATVAAMHAMSGCGADTGETTQVSVEGHSFTVDGEHGYFGEVRSLLKQSAFAPSYVNCTLKHVKEIVVARDPKADVEDLRQDDEATRSSVAPVRFARFPAAP